MSRQAGFYQKWALFIGIFLMAIKFYAWYSTKSNAILSDALESIVNVVASGFALYSIALSARPKDSNHPYGHGKIEFIAVGLEGMFIFFAGLAAIYKGTYTLIYPQAIIKLPLGLALTLIAGLANYGLARMLLVKGKELTSKTMQADGHHLMTDVYSSIGLILGLALVYLTNIYWLDSALAILFGGLILKTAYDLLRDSVAGIMDETDRELSKKIIDILKNSRQPNWIDIHNLRIQRFGAHLHLDGHVTLPYYISLQQAHDELDNLSALLRKNIPLEVEFFIHSDPCEPVNNCAICIKPDCPVRMAPFKRKINWSLNNALPNIKHQLNTPN